MGVRFDVECEDDQARAVSELARRYGVTEEEVLQQLIDLGLEAAEEPTS